MTENKMDFKASEEHAKSVKPSGEKEFAMRECITDLVKAVDGLRNLVGREVVRNVMPKEQQFAYDVLQKHADVLVNEDCDYEDMSKFYNEGIEWNVVSLGMDFIECENQEGQIIRYDHVQKPDPRDEIIEVLTEALTDLVDMTPTLQDPEINEALQMYKENAEQALSKAEELKGGK